MTPPGRNTRRNSTRAAQSSGTCSSTSVCVMTSKLASAYVRRCTSSQRTPSRTVPVAVSVKYSDKATFRAWRTKCVASGPRADSSHTSQVPKFGTCLRRTNPNDMCTAVARQRTQRTPISSARRRMNAVGPQNGHCPNANATSGRHICLQAFRSRVMNWNTFSDTNISGRLGFVPAGMRVPETERNGIWSTWPKEMLPECGWWSFGVLSRRRRREQSR